MKNLILIVSLPRSGSTLLQNILSNNEFVQTVSEPWLMLPFLSIYKPTLVNATYDYETATTALHDYTKQLGKEEELIDILRASLEKMYSWMSKGDDKYVLDKTPRYYQILPVIRKVFPHAKIIILKRNPLAVLNSAIDTWGATHINKLILIKQDLLEAPFLLQEFLDLSRNDENVREVLYENIVRHPEREIKSLYDWLGIPYFDSILDYSSNKKVDGLYGDKNVRSKYQKLEQESLDKWKDKLSNKAWKNFFAGYSQYFNKDFLLRYGNYSFDLKGNTSIFQEYLTASENGFSNFIPNKVTFIAYLKYRMKLKLKVGLYSLGRRNIN